MKAIHLAAMAIILVAGRAATAAEPDAADPADKKICKTLQVTGSLVRKKRICMTQSAWDDQKKRSQDAVDKVFNNANSINTPKRDQFGMESTPGATPGGLGSY